jgi:hypothetical protein
MIDPLVTQSHLNKIRKDKFTMVLTIPNILKELNTRRTRSNDLLNLDSMQFSLFDITIPKVTIPEHQVHYGQQNINITSYDRPAYPPITVNFEVDNEFKNYWVMWKWLQMLNDVHDASYTGKDIFPNGPPKLEPDVVYNYTTHLYVIVKNEYNKDVTKFTFLDSFITELGDLVFNYRDTELLNTHFTFVFNKLDVELLDND